MKRFIILIFFLVLGLLKAQSIALGKAAFSNPEQITAGEDLVLVFNNVNGESRMLINSSYGKTILSPKLENELALFQIPDFISKKAGTLEWRLVRTTKSLKGKIRIVPLDKPEVIENYFGPRSIQAGDRDYSMLVSIPTDKFDNPLIDGTKAEISEFFHGVVKKDSMPMKNMFAWKNIYSKRKAGNITVASSSKGLQGKEMISKVYPSLPTGFSLEIYREHQYADGNQITEVKTTVIRDEYENIISDGTSIEFLIKDSKNAIQKTYATTIDGVATAQLLHPESADVWNISANVTGMAISDEIVVIYEPVIKDFNVKLDLKNKIIMVGPLTSFLGQLIPDGVEVSLSVLDEKGEIHHNFSEPSKDGFAFFKLHNDINYIDTYTFKIETLGVIKSIQ